MEKILIYPYNKMYESYITGNTLGKEFAFGAIVAPKGWGLENEIIKDELGNPHLVECDFSKKLKECSMVWFVEDDIRCLAEEVLFSKLYEAIRAQKKFYLLEETILNSIERLCRQYQIVNW